MPGTQRAEDRRGHKRRAQRDHNENLSDQVGEKPGREILQLYLSLAGLIGCARLAYEARFLDTKNDRIMNILIYCMKYI